MEYLVIALVLVGYIATVGFVRRVVRKRRRDLIRRRLLLWSRINS
jgi:hypothetical protein